MTDPGNAPEPDPGAETRFDLGALEFDAVRELLAARLSTPLGRRAVDALAPLEDVERTRQILRSAEQLAACLRDDQEPPLSGVGEVRGWLEPFFAGEHALGARELAELGRLLRAARSCRTWLERRPQHADLVALGATMPQLDDLVSELELVVDVRGEVLSTASAKLGEIRREIDVAESGVRAEVQRFLAQPDVGRYLQSPEPSWRHGRPVFQVRQEFRDRVRGVLHDRSQSGATLFIEPSTVLEAANRLSDARAAENREIQVVLAHVAKGLRRCRAEIEHAVAALADFDLLGARARLIAGDGFAAPEIASDGRLRLCDARHPILVQSLGAAQIVPLDVALGDPHHVVVVTGPNTGGKTVVLKTIGLLSLMALCGVPVPAGPGTRIPAFDGVFADIGDEQAISQNLSTFSSHVRRIARCVTKATERSLVLLDELGAGTDPEEGGALGYAVLQHLERRRVRAVVTTHLGRLKEFAYQHTGAENGSMSFDGKTLRPQYRLVVGVPGCSHALDIAGQVGMPAELVDEARQLMGRPDAAVEEVVQRVQETRQEAEADRKRTAKLTRAAERTEQEARERLAELERRHLWLQEEADALVDEQLRRARAAIEKSCGVLRNAPKPYQDVAVELIEEIARVLADTSVHRRRMRFVGSLRKDDIVYVPRLARRCVVRKVDRAREVCTIDVGKLRMEVPFEDLSWVQPLNV
ncbi:MAG: hypothetical protein AAF628_21140 [Planctomycetota bacterium]